MDLWNVGILPQHYTASQLRRPRLELDVKASKVKTRNLTGVEYFYKTSQRQISEPYTNWN
jgi:hypothetical protein